MFATIPMKAQEPAIQVLSGRTGIPLTLLETEDVRKVEYRFRQVPFEKHSKHSVSVSAPCAYLASEKGRMLLISVTFPGGATLSIAQQKKAIRILRPPLPGGFSRIHLKTSGIHGSDTGCFAQYLYRAGLFLPERCNVNHFPLGQVKDVNQKRHCFSVFCRMVQLAKLFFKY